MSQTVLDTFKGCACGNKVQCCGDHGESVPMSPLKEFLDLYAPLKAAKGGIARDVYAALPTDMQAQYPWQKLIIQIGLMGTKKANDPDQKIPMAFAAEFLSKCEEFPDRTPSRRASQIKPKNGGTAPFTPAP